jgi:hypothetical protein
VHLREPNQRCPFLLPPKWGLEKQPINDLFYKKEKKNDESIEENHKLHVRVWKRWGARERMVAVVK